MPHTRRLWANVAAAVVGGIALGFGLVDLQFVGSLWGALWAVIGFLLLGWSVFDLRRFRPGTPESEVRGGRDIE